MDITDITIENTDTFDYGEIVTVEGGGGSRVFGNTVISWVPSASEMAVKITVTMGGAAIKKKTMTPEDNQMTYYGVSGEEWSKGKIDGSFGPYGKTGTLRGDLSWCWDNSPGRYAGFIGEWESPNSHITD